MEIELKFENDWSCSKRSINIYIYFDEKTMNKENYILRCKILHNKLQMYIF